jgi:DNA primase
MGMDVDQQADIVSVIGEYLKLHKTGPQKYIGRCPFHKEEAETLSVSTSHGYFYCYGCHEKGDVFAFVMKSKKIGFREAIRVVADTGRYRSAGQNCQQQHPARPTCA